MAKTVPSCSGLGSGSELGLDLWSLVRATGKGEGEDEGEGEGEGPKAVPSCSCRSRRTSSVSCGLNASRLERGMTLRESTWVGVGRARVRARVG